MTTDYEPPPGYREPFQLADDERPDADAWYAFDDGFDTKEQAIEAQRRMHERGVADGIARERAAVLNVFATKYGDLIEDILGDVERGDHHPEHADALQRRDDRVRAEVLAGVVECCDTMASAYDEEPAQPLMARAARAVLTMIRMCEAQATDALKRALAEANDTGFRAGQQQGMEDGKAIANYGIDQRLAEAREAGRRELVDEARAHAVDVVSAYARLPLGTMVVSTATLDERAAALRAATGEGSDA